MCPDIQTALTKETPDDTGLIAYAKEQSWQADFPTAAVTNYFPGAARIVTVPSSALVRDGTKSFVYVQHTPERFEFREVTIRRIFGDAVEVTSRLNDTDRIVVRGVASLPRP